MTHKFSVLCCIVYKINYNNFVVNFEVVWIQ